MKNSLRNAILTVALFVGFLFAQTVIATQTVNVSSYDDFVSAINTVNNSRETVTINVAKDLVISQRLPEINSHVKVVINGNNCTYDNCHADARNFKGGDNIYDESKWR